MIPDESGSPLEQPRDRLYRLLDDTSLPPRETQRRLLGLGMRHLDVEAAHLQRRLPDADQDQVVASVGEPEGEAAFPEGTLLDRATTYCRRTVQTDASVALSNAPEQGWADDPAYRTHDLDCYLGATVRADGAVYGTVCFVGTDPRSEPFTAAERAFAELVARHLGRLAASAGDGDTDAGTAPATERRPGRYEALLKLSPDAVVLTDEDGDIEEMNERATELTGYDAAALQGQSILDLAPAPRRDRYRGLFEGGKAERRLSAFDDGMPLELVTADGSEVPVEVSAGTVDLGDRRLSQYVLRDISDRRERERKLARRQEFLKTTQEAADIGGWELDLTDQTVQWADEVKRIHGVSLDYEPDLDDGLSFYHPEDRPELEAAIEAAVEDGEGYDLELRIIRADGMQRWVNTVGRPVSEDGSVVAVRGVFRDVTERRERERRLRIRDRAVEAAPVGVTVADATQLGVPLIYTNDEFERLTGYDEEFALGRNCRFLQGERTRESAVDAIRDAIAGAESLRTEILNYRRDGTPFWNELTIAPVTGRDGEVTEFVGVQRDVTARKRRERLIEVLDRVLRHNIRNEMNVIGGYAEEITSRSDGETAAMAERIEAAAAELTGLTETAREFEMAALESDETGARDVVADVENVVADLRTVSPDTTFQVTVRADDPPTVRGSRQLVVALRELGENAAAHGAATVTYEVASTADDSVTVRIHDDGPGLPEAERSTVAAGRETPLQHGSGLGLWLVNWTVTGLGGELSATVDDGTTITLELVPADGHGSPGQGPATALGGDAER
jgi:PAS domain S-box-containing protein